MRYNLTEFKDKNNQNVYAKDGCNICYGTGCKGLNGKVKMICQCTKLVKNDNNEKYVNVRSK